MDVLSFNCCVLWRLRRLRQPNHLLRWVLSGVCMWLLVCVCVCVLGTSALRWPRPHLGCYNTEKNYGLEICAISYISIEPDSSASIATDYGLTVPGIESRWVEIFRRPDRPWGPPSLLNRGYWVFPGGRKRPGDDADSSLPSSAEV